MRLILHFAVITFALVLALQLRSSAISESLGHHGSEIMDGERVG